MGAIRGRRVHDHLCEILIFVHFPLECLHDPHLPTCGMIFMSCWKWVEGHVLWIQQFLFPAGWDEDVSGSPAHRGLNIRAPPVIWWVTQTEKWQIHERSNAPQPQRGHAQKPTSLRNRMHSAQQVLHLLHVGVERHKLIACGVVPCYKRSSIRSRRTFESSKTEKQCTMRVGLCYYICTI